MGWDKIKMSTDDSTVCDDYECMGSRHLFGLPLKKSWVLIYTLHLEYCNSKSCVKIITQR